MKISTLYIAIFAFTIMSCDNLGNSDKSNDSIVGTWKLISAITINKDSSFSNFNSNQKMIKIINDSHFAFFRHDLENGKGLDTVFVSGGGSYSFKNGKYIERLEYCNYREWENNEFEFKAEIKFDTLKQSGIEKIEDLGIEEQIIETYIRLK